MTYWKNLPNRFIDTYSAGFHRENFQHVGGFNPALQKNEDVDLSYRLANAGINWFSIVMPLYIITIGKLLGLFHFQDEESVWRMIVYRAHPGSYQGFFTRLNY
jgi:hypothetical protein